MYESQTPQRMISVPGTSGLVDLVEARTRERGTPRVLALPPTLDVFSPVVPHLRVGLPSSSAGSAGRIVSKTTRSTNRSMSGSAAWLHRSAIVLVAFFVFGPLAGAQPPDSSEGPSAAVAEGNTAAGRLIVETIRELDPQSTLDRLRAVETLLNVEEVAVAAEYLQALIDDDVSDSELAASYRQLGPAFFIRLTRESGLGAGAEPFARRVLAASRNAVANPKRIRELIVKLQDRDEAVRAAAVAGISEAGGMAVGELLPVLDASRGSRSYKALRTAMAALGRDAHGPLMGALQSPDPRIQAAAIRALGDLRVQTSIPFLCRPAVVGSTPDVQMAAQETIRTLRARPAGSQRSNEYLAKVTHRLLNDGFPDRTRRMIKVWSWDPTQRAPVHKDMSPETAAAYFAAWLALDLYQIAPTNQEYERLYITTQLAAAKLTGGLDVSLRKSNPRLYKRLASLPVPQFEAVLSAELRRSEAAAIGAAEMLGHLGDQNMLARGGKQNALAQALLHGDPRVRFAAVEAIMRIDPDGPYPGAADFWQQLGRMARTDGGRHVLIVHPRAAEADNLAGMANGLGFTAIAVGTRRAAMRMAIEYPDYEAILISDAVAFWTEFLQHIRRDPRTSRIPVGLIIRREAADTAEQLARLDPLTISFPLPYDNKSLAAALENTFRLESVSRIDATVRLTQGERAIRWLSDIVSDHPSYSFYDIIQHESTLISALEVPEFAPRAAAALGALGTPKAQRALVEMASDHSKPIEIRQAASTAFRAATRRQGVQLTQSQVVSQYERYNASEALDESTQTLLGSILDSIESVTQRTSVFETTNKH